jgi:uncharacterized OsmC-like protein
MTARTGDVPDRNAVITAGVRRREEHKDPAAMRGLDRIEISVVDGLSYEARSPVERDGLMRVGEPVERGGDGTGATPLAHFLTGSGSCLLNQFVRVSIAEGLPLQFEGASVRGEFRREAGGQIQRIACEVRATGSIDTGTAQALMARAERLCYVHQTLVAAVEMTTILIVDGRELGRHVAGPARAA